MLTTHELLGQGIVDAIRNRAKKNNWPAEWVDKEIEKQLQDMGYSDEEIKRIISPL